MLSFHKFLFSWSLFLHSFSFFLYLKMKSKDQIMKKKYLFLLTILVSFLSFSQESAERFEITPAGFTQTVEREYPGKTDEELFQAVKEWAAYTIENADAARKDQLHDMLLEYRVFFPQGFSTESETGVIQWDVLFDVNFRINNQEITYEVELIEISSPNAPAFSLKGEGESYSFFNLQDEPLEKTSEERDQINHMANDIIRGVSAYINRGAEEEQD